MRIWTWQRKGCMEGKKEMEDRICAGRNILTDGFRTMEAGTEGVYAVFDGVGGLRGSAVASALAAETMAGLEAPYTPEVIREALEDVHRRLVSTGRMATTATGIAVSGETVWLFHIGNCRLYGLAEGYIRQMTTDQTKYEDLLNAGQTPEEIPESAKCVINACLGAREELIRKLVLQETGQKYRQCERLLLTSDGIHDHVSADDLEEFLAGDITEETMKKLAEKAVQGGSEDDLSIMVMEK